MGGSAHARSRDDSALRTGSFFAEGGGHPVTTPFPAPAGDPRRGTEDSGLPIATSPSSTRSPRYTNVNALRLLNLPFFLGLSAAYSFPDIGKQFLVAHSWRKLSTVPISNQS